MRYNVACALITDLGDHPGGLDILGPYVERVGPEGLDWIKADPDMDAVRGDPRFQGMIRQADARLGMPNS